MDSFIKTSKFVKWLHRCYYGARTHSYTFQFLASDRNKKYYFVIEAVVAAPPAPPAPIIDNFLHFFNFCFLYSSRHYSPQILCGEHKIVDSIFLFVQASDVSLWKFASRFRVYNGKWINELSWSFTFCEIKVCTRDRTQDVRSFVRSFTAVRIPFPRQKRETVINSKPAASEE